MNKASEISRMSRILLIAAYMPIVLGLLWVIGLCVCHPSFLLPLGIGLIIIIITKAKWPQYIPLWPALAALIALEALLFTRQVPDQKCYHPAFAKVPEISLNGDHLHLRNIRDFEYRTEKDATIRYLEEDFSLKDIRAVYYIDAFSRGEDSAHRILLCFEFRDGRSLVITPELRLPADEKSPNTLRQLYKCYAMVYTIGTEEDLLALRTDHRHDYLSIYALKADSEQAQEMFRQCLRLAAETEATRAAFPPFGAEYSDGMQQVLRILCPSLNVRRNDKTAEALDTAGALQHRPDESWQKLHRRASLGHDLAPENRADYADAVRRKAGLPARTAGGTARCVQEEQRSAPASETNSTRPEHAAAIHLDEMFTAPSAAPEATPTEPTEQDKENPQTAPVAPSKQPDILEPKDRRRQEDMAAYIEEQRLMREKQRQAEGRDREEASEKASSVDFGRIFLGRKGSGVKIIEKPKKKEAPHPLDPYTRRNLLEEEDEQRELQQQEEQENPYSDFPADKPKEKLHL